MALTVTVDSKSVSDALDAAPRKTGIAILRALKLGTKSANTLAARLASKDMGLKVGDVKRQIRLIVPTGQTLTGELRVSLKRIPLIKFGARGPEPSRGRGRGVTARGKVGRKRYPHAFIATMPKTGHRGVFEREATTRLHIQERYGPSVGHVFIVHQGEILARGEFDTTKELSRQLDRIFGE